jgi:hypothetical protein
VVDNDIKTDYLVVGAGAAAMAFTDTLLANSDATVTIVDRRHTPGGHWVDAYPYVRLHQPSFFYGVDSVPFGQDAVDIAGTNSGFYELANADEIRAYFRRVMDRHFLPTGRVRYFPCCEYLGEHRFASRVTGASWQVTIRRKLVDTTYVEGAIPATSAPPFEIASGVRCMPACDITLIDDSPERFVIIGAGKTALDSCAWLLEQGVPVTKISWVRPREAWWVNRKFQQPLAQLSELYRGIALQLEAMAESASVGEVFARLESQGYFLRIDPEVTPTMFRGAIISEAEIELLRRVRDVIRMGRVRRIEVDRIVLDEGSVPVNGRTVHIHCASRGLSRPPLRPIFEPARITVQPLMLGFVCYQFATLGVVEATVESDAEKNRLCPPIAYWDVNADYLSAYVAGLACERSWAANPFIATWAKSTRLNPFGGMARGSADLVAIDTRERIKRSAGAAVANVRKLLGQEAT